MRILKKGNNNTKGLAKSLVRFILQYGAAYWDPYGGQIDALD